MCNVVEERDDKITVGFRDEQGFYEKVGFLKKIFLNNCKIPYSSFKIKVFFSKFYTIIFRKKAFHFLTFKKMTLVNPSIL